MKGETDDGLDSQQLLSLPFTPTTLVWENINYRVNIRKGPPFFGKTTEKVILTNISGYVKPGTLMAIMGSTGAGKSTLLDILAGRNKAGVLEGKITANNVPISELDYKKICGYVTQDDCLFTFQTVRETFNFVAQLKLPAEFTKEQRDQRVQEVIDDLRLSLVSESYNGSQFVRGISGGEKKRVSIGVELVTNPGLLFLDEPTSGLDSFNAHSVMDRIKTLANNNRSIVCTIHQPRTDIFEMFDSLMLLSRGKVVYFGPAIGVTAYLSGLNFTCPLNVNTADFLMDTIVINEKGASSPTDESYVNLRQVWEEGSNQLAVVSSVQDLRNQYQPVFKHSGGVVSWVWELMCLCRRQLFNFARTPATTYVSLAQCIFMSCLIGSLFFDIGLEQTSIQNREGVLFFILTNQAFTMLSSLNQFLGERQIFQRERASGTYSVTAYFMSKCLVEAPLVLMYPFLFGSICYWLIGFQETVVKFLEFQLTLVLFVACAGSLFNFIGSVAPSLVVATVIAPITIVTLYLFGGYFINANSIPVYYRWFKYLSFFYYGFRAMAVIEFTGLEFEPCQPDALGCTYIPNGTVVLQELGMTDVNLWVCIAVLIAFVFAYRLMALTAMLILHKEVK